MQGKSHNIVILELKTVCRCHLFGCVKKFSNLTVHVQQIRTQRKEPQVG